MAAAAILKITFFAISRPLLHIFAPNLMQRLWARPECCFSVCTSVWEWTVSPSGPIFNPVPSAMIHQLRLMLNSVLCAVPVPCHAWTWLELLAKSHHCRNITSLLGQNLVSDNFDKIHFFAQMDSWHDDTCPIKTRSCFAQPKWPRISVDQ